MAASQMNDLFKALMMAALAFQQDYEKEQKEEQAELEAMSESEREDADDEEYPEEMEAEDFVERFKDWLGSEGLETYFNAKLSKDEVKRLDHILGRAP